MKYILLIFVVFVIHVTSGDITAEKLGECPPQGIHCSSCNEVQICANTEYGSVNQHIHTCPEGEHCMRGKCSRKKNPLCDGTADISFQCHSPGVFPDPFDCHFYHLCVVIFQNETDLLLMDYKHKCQESKDGQAYGFESSTLTCSRELGQFGECGGFPIPPCFVEGQSSIVSGNDNIYFVCENVDGLLYPQVFACPFGQNYDVSLQQCDYSVPTTTPEPTYPPTTPGPTYPPTTPDPTYPPTTPGPTYTSTTPGPIYTTTTTTEWPYTTYRTTVW